MSLVVNLRVILSWALLDLSNQENQPHCALRRCAIVSRIDPFPLHPGAVISSSRNCSIELINWPVAEEL